MLIAFLLLLSMRLKLLAILLHEQLIHHKQVNLCPNKQLLNTQQHAYQSFIVTLCYCFDFGMLGKFLIKML